MNPWKQINTKTDTIFVIDRPIIQNLSFTIMPPTYTNVVKYNQPGNITDIILLVNILLGISQDNGLADLNQDSEINVLDVIQLVNIILN